MSSEYLHSVKISQNYLESFGFRSDSPILSESAVTRIFDYAEFMNYESDIKFENDLWSIIGRNHKVLTDLCKNRDVDNFRLLISKLATTVLVQGFCNYSPFAGLLNNKEAMSREAIHFIDKLLSLGESMCVIPVLNPEQGVFHLEDPNINEILQGVFHNNGSFLSPPIGVGGVFGLKTSLGVYSLKDLGGRYTSMLLNKTLTTNTFNRINEIGSGLGVTPYWFYILNSCPSSGYHIFDLPSVSIMQAAFLMTSLNEDKVVLANETTHSELSSCIYLNPYWKVFDNDYENTLWLNQDSLPEIEIQVATSYLNKIAGSRNSAFLSINQEALAPDGIGGRQFRVTDLTKQYKSLSKIYRCRDFLRHGYTEEYYLINQT